LNKNRVEVSLRFYFKSKSWKQMFYFVSDGRRRLYRFPPTRGAAFCIGFDALGAFGALAAGLAAAGAFLAVVAFWVFLTSLAALKSEKK
jgi:hypothetical protein